MPRPEPGQVVARYQQYVNRGQAKLAKLLGLPVEVRAEGSYVYDQDGTRYLDCGGYGVFVLGHRHPAVTGAVARQLGRQPLSTRLLLSPVLAEAAESLIGVAPSGLERVTFTTSGAEATEFAVKLGRVSGRARIVAMRNGFHGKTLAALSVSGRERYQAPFRPLLSGVEHVPFGDAGALTGALSTGPPALVICEPVQAEGGVRIPPPGYLAEVRDVCDRFNALLVADEIQTGLGRLGAWWGCDREGVAPDVLLTGKALGGGVMPAAAVLSTRAVYRPLDDEPLLHSSTFAGNPLAAAAAVATLRVMRDEAVPARAAGIGRKLLARLQETTAKTDEVREVRGLGLMIGIEFRHDHHSARFLELMLDQRVLVCYSLNSDRVVRLTPPVTLSDTDCEWLLAAVASALTILTG